MVLLATRCPACLLLRSACMCGEITPFTTRTRVTILRHFKEKFRSSNTGRVAAMALKNAEIVDHGVPGDRRVLPEPGTWLAWPDGPPSRVAPQPPPSRIVFLDASWQQARRMRRRLEWLRGLPVLSLPLGPVPKARMRESPGEGRVSTIEAIAAALRLLEGEAPAAELERLFAILTGRVRAFAGR